MPNYNTPSIIDHDEIMNKGFLPNAYKISKQTLSNILKPGNNVLSIQVHNSGSGLSSNDLNIRAFFSLGILDNSNNYYSVPAWLNPFVASGLLHTNFNLSKTEPIILTGPTGSIVDSITPIDLQLNHSQGRVIMSVNANRFIFNFPTPFAPNTTTGYLGYAHAPIFSLNGGFYSQVQTLAISTVSSSNIRYTTTGDIPQTTSSLYLGQISISSTSVISARCFSNSTDTLPSSAIKQTYFISEIGLGNLPVISITTDVSNLYDPVTGIYVDPTNCFYDWQKFASIEYFDKQKQKKFESGVGIQIHGGSSRWLAQKAFRIEFNGKFGDSKLNYPLIPDKPFIQKYNSFILRNGGNDYAETRFRDAFMQRVMKNTHVDYQAYEPVNVYLNGKYWGEYELREQEDNDYIMSNHGIDKDKIDLLRTRKNGFSGHQDLYAITGSDTGFFNINNYITSVSPSNPNYYSNLCKMLDMDNYVDYIAGNVFYGKLDWFESGNNIKLWRPQTPGAKWRYVMWDNDIAMGLNGPWATSPSVNYLLADINSVTNYHSKMLGKIVQNNSFRDYFVNRYADLMNTIFQYNNMEKIAYAMRDSLAPSMQKHINRWGAVYNETYNDWWNYIDNDLLDWVTPRLTYARNELQNYYSLAGQINITIEATPLGAGKIQISTIIPELTPTWTGTYFNGIPVTITAIPNPGYSFVNWTANPFITNPNNASFTSNITSDQTFVANFTGNTASPQITISEINYHSDFTLDAGYWFELHNYSSTNAISLGGWQLKDEREAGYFTIPANVVMPANGYLVFCRDTAKFKTQHPSITNFMGELPFSFGQNSNQIRLFNHENNLITSVKFNTSNSWSKGADGLGRTLELVYPSANLNLSNNWFDGCISGSPGAKYSPCNDKIIISEVNYKSASTANAGDWIELHNTTTSDINISGWRFINKDNVYNIPNPTLLPANGYLVLIKDLSLFQTIHPTVNNYVGTFTFGLSSSGDELKLYNNSPLFGNNGILQYSMVYDNVAPWPITANGGGRTLELQNPKGDVNDGSNWLAGCLNGSPGKAYTPCSPIGLEENINHNQKLIVYPNPFSSQAIIQVISLNSNIVFIMYDQQGREVENMKIKNETAGQQSVEIKVNRKNLSNGIYFYKVTSDDGIIGKGKIVVE